jgi:hypothetical protein
MQRPKITLFGQKKKLNFAADKEDQNAQDPNEVVI